MKFGVREICDVVLKAKANQKVGNKIFYKGEPVIYFDTLKTSSMEGAATTVYAQGGRGNSRLVAWEGERTVTFTMEDALISPAGFMILSGAGLIEASTNNKINVHVTEQTVNTVLEKNVLTIELEETPSQASGAGIYVMILDDNGEIASEVYKPTAIGVTEGSGDDAKTNDKKIQITFDTAANGYTPYAANPDGKTILKSFYDENNNIKTEEIPVLVDYYVEKTSGVQQIDITPDKFGGNYYLEASTLFRTQQGVDMPAEFIIPNCKIQSNFTFTMASSGDPSSFTFTMDAFPDYTRFDKTKKVLAAIQIIDEGTGDTELTRVSTYAGFTHKANNDGAIIDGIMDGFTAVVAAGKLPTGETTTDTQQPGDQQQPSNP